jgi:hypothetical protein
MDLPALLCKNCSRPMWLPPATHPDISQGLGRWPRGALIRTFLCPLCRHLYEYLAHDVQPVPVLEAPHKSGASDNVVCILLTCGVGGCASLLRIRTVMAFDKDPRAEASEMLGASHAHEIPCDRGHILSGSIGYSAMSFDAYFDEEWKIG